MQNIFRTSMSSKQSPRSSFPSNIWTLSHRKFSETHQLKHRIPVRQREKIQPWQEKGLHGIIPRPVSLTIQSSQNYFSRTHPWHTSVKPSLRLSRIIISTDQLFKKKKKKPFSSQLIMRIFASNPRKRELIRPQIYRNRNNHLHSSRRPNKLYAASDWFSLGQQLIPTDYSDPKPRKVEKPQIPSTHLPTVIRHDKNQGSIRFRNTDTT